VGEFISDFSTPVPLRPQNLGRFSGSCRCRRLVRLASHRPYAAFLNRLIQRKFAEYTLFDDVRIIEKSSILMIANYEKFIN